MAWLAFSFDGQELARYSLADASPGEAQATAELLAYECGIRADQIQAQVIREPES